MAKVYLEKEEFSLRHDCCQFLFRHFSSEEKRTDSVGVGEDLVCSVVLQARVNRRGRAHLFGWAVAGNTCVFRWPRCGLLSTGAANG